MISWASAVFAGISALLSIGVPVAAAVWFCRRYQAPFTTVLVGALTFFIMQIVLRLPLLAIVPMFIHFDVETLRGLLIYSAFLSLTATLFEELGRLLFIKLFRRQKDWRNAVAMGIGHGGIEAIIIVGLSAVANAILLALLVMDLPLGLPQEAVQPLLDTAPYLFLLGGVERMLVLPIHVAFSLLVMAGALHKKYGYVVLAIGAHFLLNFPALWMLQNWGALLTEVYILLFSAAAWALIIRSRRTLFSEN